MQEQIDAVFEGGVLKPLGKLNLPEHAMVHLFVTSPSERQRPLSEWPRSQPANLELADPAIDRAEVLAATAKIPESVVDELRRDREGRS